MSDLITRLFSWLRGAKPDVEDRIEAAYWWFDARRSGYGLWRNAPMSERDAFKAAVRVMLRGVKR